MFQLHLLQVVLQSARAFCCGAFCLSSSNRMIRDFGTIDRIAGFRDTAHGALSCDGWLSLGSLLALF